MLKLSLKPNWDNQILFFLKNIFKNNRFFNKKYNKIGAELGLYLSKQIIEAHQGGMYTEDYQNEKSIIGFILPTNITFSLNKQKHLPE